MDTFDQLWIIWGLLFAAIEGAALLNKKPDDTLSAHVWEWIGVNGRPKPTGYKYRRGALGAFFIWLIAHFFWGV